MRRLSTAGTSIPSVDTLRCSDFTRCDCGGPGVTGGVPARWPANLPARPGRGVIASHASGTWESCLPCRTRSDSSAVEASKEGFRGQESNRHASAAWHRHDGRVGSLAGRLPLDHQNCGVVAEFVVLMSEDRVDEQAEHFRGVLPGGGRPDDVVGEAL